MRDDLSNWAYSDKIKPLILASKSIEDFQINGCISEHDKWYSNWVRFPIVYWTIKTFPNFNERIDCLNPDISKLSDFVTGFEIKEGAKNQKESPKGIFFWDDDKNERFVRNKNFLDQIFVSVTPAFKKFYEANSGTCLRAINRNFDGVDHWVAIFMGQKFGSDKLVTYLDARTEYFDLKTKTFSSC